MHCCPAFVPTFLPRVTATLPFPSTPVEASTLDFPLALLADDFTVVHDGQYYSTYYDSSRPSGQAPLNSPLSSNVDV